MMVYRVSRTDTGQSFILQVPTAERACAILRWPMALCEVREIR